MAFVVKWLQNYSRYMVLLVRMLMWNIHLSSALQLSVFCFIQAQEMKNTSALCALHWWFVSLKRYSSPCSHFVRGGSMAEWLGCRTWNLEVPGTSPALTTIWRCFSVDPIQLLHHACKIASWFASYQLGFLTCHVEFVVFVSNYLSGVPTN